MTTAAVSSYPQLVKRSTTALGEVVKVGDFELIQATVPATNMESGGWKEKIASGLKEASDLVLTLNYIEDGLTTLMGDWSAGTVSPYTITYKNTEVATFSALCSHVKVLGADADNPSAPQQVEVTLEITGAVTLEVPEA